MSLTISRREIVLAGLGLVLVGSAARATTGQSLPDPDPTLPALNDGGVVAAAAIENDIAIGIADALAASGASHAIMQTNGVLLRLDLTISAGTINPRLITIHVSDLGHDDSGAPFVRHRALSVRRTLVGPVGRETLEGSHSHRLLLVLAEPIFNQDESWRTTVESVELAAGWHGMAAAETIAGAQVQRHDSLRYPPFPVKPLTPPFQRIAPDAPLLFELTGVHDFGRDGRMFARAEAWLRVGGRDGTPVGTAAMVASTLTDAAAPSGLPAPVYALPITADPGLPQGAGEVLYRVYPFIGPPWSSDTGGTAFPTLSPPRGVPVCHDLSGSWAPLYGLVAANGIGLPGTDPSGLSTSLADVSHAQRPYRDIAAVAAAVRLANRAITNVGTLDGGFRRVITHDDLAGGVAVLPPLPGSASRDPAAAYRLRTAMGSAVAYPPGGVAFEIRSLSGRADGEVRLCGANADGSNHIVKTLPNRTLLRGLWLDGGNAIGAAHTLLDGGSAGLPIRPPAASAVCYLISMDCAITENPDASAAAPLRTRCGYLWDIRVRYEGAGNAAALGVTTALAGLVASVGSSYAARVPQRMTLTTIAGCRFSNVALREADATTLVNAGGRLAINVRIDYSVSMPAAAIALAVATPSIGGLGLANIFIRGLVGGSSPAVQVGADSMTATIDNAIIRHFGSDMPNSTRLSEGRSNIGYQSQGYGHIEKLVSVSYSAFHCYSAKGDNFVAPETPNRMSTSWSATRAFHHGQIVHDTVGAAVATSVFYQALRPVPAGTPLSDRRFWLCAGLQFNRAFGARPLRQGNGRLRYHIGCKGNVAASTYNSGPPGWLSGYGFVWGRDERTDARYADFYSDRFNNDYRPNPDGPLAGKVAVGDACLPFDLSGAPRRNDGTGAAGAYELG